MVTLPRHYCRLPENFTKYLLSAITIELFKYRNYHEYLNQHKMFVIETFNINKDIKVLVTSYPIEKHEDLYEVSASYVCVVIETMSLVVCWLLTLCTKILGIGCTIA